MLPLLWPKILTAFVLIFMGFVQVGGMMLVRVATEIAVTNRRVILKRGLISRKVEEMRVDFIEGSDVNQTVMGRMFGYGQVKCYGTGTENIFFPKYTSDPIGFRRAIQSARSMNLQGFPPNQMNMAQTMEAPQQTASVG